MSKMLSARKRLASLMLKFNLAEVSNHPMNPWRRQNEFSASLHKTEETKQCVPAELYAVIEIVRNHTYVNVILVQVFCCQ